MGKTRRQRVFEWFFGKANSRDVCELFMFTIDVIGIIWQSVNAVLNALADHWGMVAFCVGCVLYFFWHAKKVFSWLASSLIAGRLLKQIYLEVSENRWVVVCIKVPVEGVLLPRFFRVDSLEVTKAVEDWLAQQRSKGEEKPVSS